MSSREKLAEIVCGVWRSKGIYAGTADLVDAIEAAGFVDLSDRDALQRIVAGALRASIHDHGAITEPWIGSAAKRIVGQISGAALNAGEKP